jgi:hypothetical protein
VTVTKPVSDQLVEKVRKLLALAESPNENEAALAAEKAQELMLRHGIDMAQIAASEGTTTIGVDETHVTGTPVDPWRRGLLHVVATAMGGRVVYQHDSRKYGQFWIFAPVGTSSAILDLFRYVEGTLVTLSAIATASRRETWVHGRTWRASFLMGAVARIDERLKRRRREIEVQADNSAALVIVRDAVDEHMKERFPQLRKTTAGRSYDRDAYQHGRTAGANISLGDKRVGQGRGELPA